MDLEQQILANLNPQQQEAVTHHGTPLMVIAGAGSGKTRVITHRIAYLSHVVGIPLWQILAVTFTNKAAREMRSRICYLLSVPDDPSLAISTFHSRCAAILRREAASAGLERNFAILDEHDQQTAVKKAMEACDIDPKRVKPGQALHFITLAKMKLLTPTECREEFDSSEIPYAEIYEHYDRVLNDNNALDFEDLIFRCVRLFREHEEVRKRWADKYRYVLIDEFQDTNYSQFELVKLLVQDHHHICVVGDEDQSIYSWRGADVSNLLGFQKEFPDTKLIRLEQNYRSAGNILKGAGAVIENNSMRIGKKLWTEKELGDPFYTISGTDDREEAEQVAKSISTLLYAQDANPEDVAIFYRSHRISRPFEDAFIRAKVPYRIIGGMRFYERREIKDLLSFLRLADQPTNDLAFQRIVNVPTRGIGAKSFSDIASRAVFRSCSQFEAARQLLAEDAFKGKARKGLEKFLADVKKWHVMAAEEPTSKILKAILEDTDYRKQGVGDPESLDGAARLENIDELETVVSEFEAEYADHSLAFFLETMALDSQREERDDSPKVSLMTVHNAKGLEFDYVFIVALDQGVFPNSRTVDNPEQFEEERRLFYVALTRARRRVYLSRAERRMTYGQWDYTEPSVFLRELPQEVLDQLGQETLGLSGRSRYSGYSSRPSASSWARRSPASSSVSPLSGMRRAKQTRRAGFNVGDRVEDPVLGPGTITEVSAGFSASKVYVEFDDGRSQEITLNFSRLKKIDS
ncbi:UvrD-helicase domain-containing protein [bacterium]|nr:UvrD-helicase domain-containing protein [bacterium]